MKKVSSLVENYIKSKTSTILDDKKTPINISQKLVPLRPENRWEKIGKKCLIKKFQFVDHDNRDRFVQEVLEYERDFGHRAKIIIENLAVTIEVGTKDIDIVTELDREYARKTDVIYKEICYFEDLK